MKYKIHFVCWKTGFMCVFPRKINKICETEYLNLLPGYSSTKKYLQITGYPGNRYSALDTLLTSE